MKQRVEYIDLAKGFAMIMLIYVHTSINYPENPFAHSWCRRMIGSMYVPVFFIMSGMFFSTRLPFGQWIKKKAKRLVVPFVCFYLLTYLMNCVICGILHVQTKNDFHWSDVFQVFYKDVFANNVIWFLLALFWASILMYFVVKYVKIRPLRLCIVAILGGGGILLGEYHINIPLYIDTALTAVPLLYIGFLCKEYQLMEKVERMASHRRWALMLFLFVVGFIADYTIGKRASLVNNQQSDPLSFYGGAIAGSIALIALCNLIGKLPLVSFIGRNSMLVLCTQMYLINVIVRVVKKLPIDFYFSSLITLLLVCMCYYALAPFVKRYIPWIIGENKQ